MSTERCPVCNQEMFRTGENQPSMPPVWMLACTNKHVKLLRTDDPPPIDRELNCMWREAIMNRTTDEWELA